MIIFITDSLNVCTVQYNIIAHSFRLVPKYWHRSRKYRRLTSTTQRNYDCRVPAEPRISNNTRIMFFRRKIKICLSTHPLYLHGRAGLVRPRTIPQLLRYPTTRLEIHELIISPHNVLEQRYPFEMWYVQTHIYADPMQPARRILFKTVQLFYRGQIISMHITHNRT